MSQHNENIRRTRSGRPISTSYRADSPHASTVRSSSPKRKPRKNAKDKSAAHKLTAPLSILTKDMTNVPVRDMETWVQRSLEDRHKETEQRKGYVTRPMNSFMLYRSAYAERTKAWCAQNNHQVVSSVSGASWPLEPAEIREFYNNLSKIERHNHQLAHPNYKFSPAKPGTSNRKRKGTDDIQESDADGDWATTHGVKNTRHVGREASYPALSAPTLGSNDQAFITHTDPYPKTWESPLINIRPAAYQVNRTAPTQHHPYQFYTTTYYPAPPHHASSNVHLLTAPSILDASGLTFGSGLVGLPGTSFHELTSLRSQASTPAAAPIDPQLDGHDSSGGFGDLGGLTYLPYDAASAATIASTHYMAEATATYGELIPLQHEEELSSVYLGHQAVEEEESSRRVEQRETWLESRISVQEAVDKARQDSWHRGLSEIPGSDHALEFEPFLGDNVALIEHNEDDFRDKDEDDAKHMDEQGGKRSQEKGMKTT